MLKIILLWKTVVNAKSMPPYTHQTPLCLHTVSNLDSHILPRYVYILQPEIFFTADSTLKVSHHRLV